MNKGSGVKAETPVTRCIAVGVGSESFHSLPATIKHKKNKKEDDHNECAGGNQRATTNWTVEKVRI